MKIIHERHDGYTELNFLNRDGRTVADTRSARGQARISAELHMNDEDTPVYFLITMGGGLTEGEHYVTKINARDNTHALVTTQAPTYVFKCNSGKTTYNDFTVHVGKNAILEYLPDDVIPYGNSRYSQTSEVTVDKGGSLLFADGITAGWAPNGADFQYVFSHMMTHIYYDGSLVYNDNLILEPRNYDLAGLGFYDKQRNYSSLVIVDERVTDAFVEDLQEQAKDIDNAIVGVSHLEGPAAIIRVLGDSLHSNKRILLNFANYIRHQFYGLSDINLRKDVSFRR